MRFIARQRRNEGADQSGALRDPDTMSVMAIHGVKRSGTDLVGNAGVQFLDRSTTFKTIARLKVVLLPKHHLEPRLKNTVGQRHTHSVLRVQETYRMPLVAMCFAFRAKHVR